MCDEDFEDVSLVNPADQTLDSSRPAEKVCRQVEEQTESNQTPEQILDICDCFGREPVFDGSEKSVTKVYTQELPQTKGTPETIDQNKLLPPFQNDFIPEEILLSLTTVPNSCCRGESLLKSPKDLKSSVRPTDRVWHHPSRRSKFKHLIDQPISLARAGRDISFLCDAVCTKCSINVMPVSSAAIDKSAVRAQCVKPPTTKQGDVPESVIPDEYHIVKNKGVLGLEYYEDKYTTLLEDDEKKLRVFPSMKPSGRAEAIQLSQVMDDMLEKVGFNEDDKQELKGATQIHHLLDLVKKEQDIYNLVFHELIRQISVDCGERGELLAKIRERYVSLLDHIPRHLISMHNEIMMQRLLDKQLVLELFLFQNAVEKLNSELGELRERDRKATKMIAKTQEELSNALIEAHKNANLLDEYHQLYELQRKRLIAQIDTLTQEKEWWTEATYSLALKVTEEHNLKLVHDLEVSEKLWTKVAQHFVVMLGMKDAEDQAKLQQATADWRDKMKKFTKNLQDEENSSLEKRKSILSGLQKWHEYLLENKSSHQGMKSIPKDMLHALLNDLKDWHELISQDYERFEGSLLLANQEALSEITQLQSDWTDLSLALFSRHQWASDEKLPEQITMEELNNSANALCQRCEIILSGENGTAWHLMKFQDMFESCQTKFDFVNLENKGSIEHNLLKLSDFLPILISQLEEVVTLAATQNDGEKESNLPDIREQLGEVNKMIQDWLSSLFKMINHKDTKLTHQVAIIQSAMSHLLVDILLHVVRDTDEKTKKVYFKYLPGPNTVDMLEEKALIVAIQLNILSTQMYRWCKDTVEAMVKQQKAAHAQNPENELKELEKLKTESSEWIDVCETLLSGIQARPVHLLSSRSEEVQSHINMTRDLCTACLQHSSTNILQMSESELSLLWPGMTQVAEGPTTVTSFENLKIIEDAKAETSATVQVEDATDIRKTPQPECTDGAKRTVGDEGKSFEIMEIKDFQSPSKSTITYIGEDTNIYEIDLKETPLPVEKADFDVVLPVKPKAMRNYEALVEVGVLQKQLVEAEQRALQAEERASSLEANLQEALDKIRDMTLALETKELQQLHPDAEKSKISIYQE
ncbi:axonemal dynein light chain domain-containing protein 1 isoform X2 [Hypanus sabinus]|uniref:axonemal dynein light chain domain-containing protein 1 isoform X2 n=1 Tax=Hypanus sabinus TaxID=79690 RepID=UPI0028C3A4A0|nr:axonemal dynein light chain domain-containing protein 1 isoform X2 [Hypanus sabinus]